MFTMNTLHRTFKDKLYPGGEVERWDVDLKKPAPKKLQKEFEIYLKLLMISRPEGVTSLYHVANELSLDNQDRLKFITREESKKEAFLFSRLRYQSILVAEAEKNKDVFQTN